MFFFLLLSFIFSEMSQNLGSSYFANSKGARSKLVGTEAMFLNPANLYLDETHTFDINSYYEGSLYNFGTTLNFQGEFALFFSVDGISSDFAYDGYSIFGSYATPISERFSIGASFGYFSSSSFSSELKYSVSASFSPWNLKKKFDKWLISFGLHNNFLSNNQNQFFTSFSYIHRFYAISFDILSSSLEEVDSNNEEVFSISLSLTDYFRLTSSAKIIDFETGNNVVYGTGFDLFTDQIKLSFGMLFDLSNKNYYSFTLSFLGE